jgi:site-specific recombinase XerC
MKEKLPKFFQRVAGTDMLRVCMKVPPAARKNLPDPYKDKAYLIQHLGTSDVREAQRIERRENYIGIFTRLIDVAKPKPLKWAFIPPSPEEVQRSLAWVEQLHREIPTDGQKAAQRMIDAYVAGRFTPAVGVYERVADEGDEKPVIRFEPAVDLWADEKKVPDPTRRSYKARMQDFAQLIGHDIGNRVTWDDLVAFKDALVKAGKASKTVKNQLGYVKTIIQWLVDNGKIDTNPLEKPVKYKVVVDHRTTRKDFDEDDRAIIYRCALAETRALYKWANLLMLFSGMRDAEFAEAYTRDIRLIDGVWCLVIDREHRLLDNETIKNDESIRKVPLHRAVLDAGFLKYVSDLPDGPLFPQLDADRDGRRRADASRKLGVWLRETAGITDRRKVNHSHRHSVETLMCAARVRERTAFAVIGHTPQSSGDKYIHPSVKMLKQAVDKIPVPKLAHSAVSPKAKLKAVAA